MIQCPDVADMAKMRPKIHFRDDEETFTLVVGAAVRDGVVGHKTALVMRWNEDECSATAR